MLTYFLSLQPDDGSLFKSGIVTPDELKQDLIDFGTVGALSDIPDDTPNVLVFNGAGRDLKSFWNSSESAELDSTSEEADSARTAKIVETSIEEELSYAKDVLEGMLDKVSSVKNLISGN